MNCRDLQEGEILDALADGNRRDRWDVLTPQVRAAAERHLAECADCRTALEDIRRLHAAAAALPRDIAPPRDLWPDIADRITGREAAHVRRSRGRRAGRAALLVAAAAAFAALVTLPTWRGEAPAGFGAATDTNALVSLSVAGRGYDRAEQELRAAYDARREDLSPETVSEVERNLQIIDRALRDARAALDRDPLNLAVGEQYRRVKQKQLELLRAAARLPNRI